MGTETLRKMKEKITPDVPRRRNARVNPNVASPENAGRIFSSTPHANRLRKNKLINKENERVLSPVPDNNGKNNNSNFEVNFNISAIEPTHNKQPDNFNILSPRAEKIIQEGSTEENEKEDQPPDKFSEKRANLKPINQSIVTPPTKRKPVNTSVSNSNDNADKNTENINYAVPKRPVRKRPKQKNQKKQFVKNIQQS